MQREKQQNQPEFSPYEFDVILVGGGLSNSLIALRLAMLRPEIRFLMVEQSSRLFGSTQGQTWSFHESDTDSTTSWVTSFASHSWPAYEVIFPQFSRRISGRYYSIRSAELRARLSPLVCPHAIFDAPAVKVTNNTVTLASGRTMVARLIIDGRGLKLPATSCGYQKFLGLDLRLSVPHELNIPLLMDATVDQDEGYRFVYVLPWSDHSLLVEDTYYSDSPDLDESALAERILAYAAGRSWRVSAIEERERGVLPIPLSDCAMPPVDPNILASGLAGGRFHPTSGYSLPDAARLAETIARSPILGRDMAADLNAAASETWRKRAYYRRLNNMLFLAAKPSERWRILRGFYERDEALIRRFYAATLTAWDRVCMLSGAPPVPVGAALKAFAANAPGERSRLG